MTCKHCGAIAGFIWRDGVEVCADCCAPLPKLVIMGPPRCKEGRLKEVARFKYRG